MNRRDLSEIAQETIEITRQGYYRLNNRTISLLDNMDGSLQEVEVFDGNKLRAIEKDEDGYFKNSIYRSLNCVFSVEDADSLEAAEGLGKPLVMNFASARYPGGGFINGARGQEESLCRESTLYASLSSDKAREMYEYNKDTCCATDSDYMLLSPNVCVFRDSNGCLLESPYRVSVFTVPAPNRHGRAAEVSEEELDLIMKERLRRFLLAATRRGYRSLVLGAWGCGAFGNDTKAVAGYFHDLFVNDGFDQYFENVIFAIYDDEEKLQIFKQVFSDILEEDKDLNKKEAIAKLYYEVPFPVPVCNHSKDIGVENIGFTQGLLVDGTPFEAELWQDGENLSMTIIIPERYEYFNGDEDYKNDCFKDGRIIPNGDEYEIHDYSALIAGMEDRGFVESMEVIQRYLYYILRLKLISFKEDYYIASVQLLRDVDGNDVAAVNIVLRYNDNNMAETPLNFRDFPGKPKGPVLKIVK